ncbi:hypothetical protein BO221_06895 [Archangium sp. Cb G35]|uniref:DUF2378 family protein n=1 Tax=Archangium sp. Cb G35 TaxID=1920190 RepID=UPI0009364273|nr:DUF2378 family protein [Archangium sp. Cb G35]OJT25594.1 hypothetical protein BO221_06895 [Archangium sp. Cb G35]
MQGLEGSRELGAERPAAARRRLVFEHTVDGLFRFSLRSRLSSQAWNGLKAVGIDLSKPLLPAYTYDTWKRALELTVVDLYPLLPREEGWRRLGQEVVNGMVHTVMGRAMVGVARLLGPLRSLRRLNNTLRSADNYVESRLTELSPTSCEVWINEVMGQPAYYQGILEACLALAGGQRARVRVLAREGTGARLHVEWEE